MPNSAPIETDALVIGAGPVGLFQVFQLGLLGINAHVVESLPFAGGQPQQLYPDKPIYDIPGLPYCTGRQLTANLLEQVKPFKPEFHFSQQVSQFKTTQQGRHTIYTTSGERFIAKVVIIAAGVGAFVPRTLTLPDLPQLSEQQLSYHPSDLTPWAQQSVLILGGDEPAVQAAVELAQRWQPTASTKAKPQITLLHRRAQLQISSELQNQFNSACENGLIHQQVGQLVKLNAPTASQGSLGLGIATPEGHIEQMKADAVLAWLGISPKLGPLANWGLEMERKQLRVSTQDFSTNLSGVFAVGDINTYPGKKKLLVSGFHECALAAFGAAAWIYPGQQILLEYTTTSTRLHQALGVA